jgi:hypothetical protein
VEQRDKRDGTDSPTTVVTVHKSRMLGFREDSHFPFGRSVALKLGVQFLIFRTESLLKHLKANGVRKMLGS